GSAKRQVTDIAKSLEELVLETDGEANAFIGVDEGTGAAGSPVIGFVFWVRADDVGGAAITAVDVARRAGACCGAGPDLYDVVVIPRDAVVIPGEPGSPRMPD
ncbi:MAG TPA: hypothetical protein VM052_06180, partial [Candidatus Limnocylindrales bacterium]|nr:hypothetical protein [Candidatus Limnocylindrales bacterium]